jgi:hypothetical protein
MYTLHMIRIARREQRWQYHTRYRRNERQNQRQKFRPSADLLPERAKCAKKRLETPRMVRICLRRWCEYVHKACVIQA